MSLMARLRTHPALQSASDRVLADLAADSELKDYDNGRTIFVAGTTQEHVFLLLDGGFELYRRARDSAHEVLLGLIRPPTLFGDATWFGGMPWPISGRAKGQTVALKIAAPAFERAVDADGALAAGMYREACRRHLKAIQVRKFILFHPTEAQVLRLLHDLALAESSASVREARISQTRLARSLGLDRTTVIRILKRLEARGVVALERGRVRLLEELDVADAELDHAPALTPLVTDEPID